MLLYQNQSNTIELSRNFHTITIHPVKFLKFSTFFEFPTTKKGVVLSPKRSFLHHNRHQKSIQGVQKHNFWYPSCHDYDKNIFRHFPMPKTGVVISPQGSFLHHNRPQKSIQGVQKHNFWYPSCHNYDKIIFQNFPTPKNGRGPITSRKLPTP